MSRLDSLSYLAALGVVTFLAVRTLPDSRSAWIVAGFAGVLLLLLDDAWRRRR